VKSIQKRAQYRGKWFEYEVAKLVHGKVVGRSKAIVVGNSTFECDPNHPCDVINEWASYECKYLKSLPKTVTNAMEQAVKNASLTRPVGNTDPTPLTPITIMGDREGHRIVVMPLNVYLELHE